MEVKMQTSFIPKKPITETRPSGGGVSLFLLLAIIVFITAIATSFGVFIYQKSLAAKIEKLTISLEESRSAYEEKSITDIIRLNDRIEQSKLLLNKHIAISPVFTVLETKIIKNIRLKTMKFSADSAGKMKLDLSGNASSYDALSKQSDVFGDLKDYITEPVVSDFSPNTDSSISFNFNALVTPKTVSYISTLTDQATTTEPAIIKDNPAI
jgi:hypothetical protein